MSRGNGVDLIGNGSAGDFKPRLGRIRGDHPNSFISKINKAVARARAASGRTKWSGTSGRFNARMRDGQIIANTYDDLRRLTRSHVPGSADGTAS